MPAPIHVLVGTNFTSEQATAVRSAHPRLVIHGEAGGIALNPPHEVDRKEGALPIWRPEIDVDRMLQDVEVLIASWIPPNLDRRAPKLRWIQFTSAGVDLVWRPCLSTMPVTITTTRGIHAIPMAEYVVSLMLVIVKQWPRLLAQQQKRVWQPFVLNEIHGKTVCLIGLGALGQSIARAATGMGMRVVGVRRTAGRDGLGDDVKAVYDTSQLAVAVAQADFVVAAVPLTSQTRGLIGSDVFAAMKPTAWFINCGRGPVVDEATLIQVLQEQRIAGAGLDVFGQMPLPPESPLWDLPNVVLTPHTMYMTSEIRTRATALICENLRRYATGEPLLNVFDREREY